MKNGNEERASWNWDESWTTKSATNLTPCCLCTLEVAWYTPLLMRTGKLSWHKHRGAVQRFQWKQITQKWSTPQLTQRLNHSHSQNVMLDARSWTNNCSNRLSQAIQWKDSEVQRRYPWRVPNSQDLIENMRELQCPFEHRRLLIGLPIQSVREMKKNLKAPAQDWWPINSDTNPLLERGIRKGLRRYSKRGVHTQSRLWNEHSLSSVVRFSLIYKYFCATIMTTDDINSITWFVHTGRIQAVCWYSLFINWESAFHAPCWSQ